jgi:hypothetical protein
MTSPSRRARLSTAALTFRLVWNGVLQCGEALLVLRSHAEHSGAVYLWAFLLILSTWNMRIQLREWKQPKTTEDILADWSSRR